MTSPIADRINELFDVMHPAGTPPRANGDVAEQVARRSGTSFTEDELRRLRDDTSRDVTEQQLGALAECFGVSRSYLVEADGNAEVAAQLRLLKAMRDQGVRDIGCSGRMAPHPADVSTVNALAAMIEGLGRAQ